MAKDLYLVLGLDRDANAHDIKRAYRRLVKELHPDTYTNSGKDKNGMVDSGRFCEVSEAYRVLSDPDKKADYDRALDARRKAKTEQERQRSGNVTQVGASTSDGRVAKADLHLEVLLAPHEALYGIDLPLRIPVVLTCKRCGGAGCGFCSGAGSVEHRVEIILSIGARTHTGIYRLSLDNIQPGLGLVIHLSVDYNLRH